MTLIVTKHAMKRAHQRFSVKRKSIERLAKRAIEQGKVVDGCRCSDPWILGNYPTNTSCREIRIYGNANYVFEYSKTAVSLITITKRK